MDTAEHVLYVDNQMFLLSQILFVFRRLIWLLFEIRMEEVKSGEKEREDVMKRLEEEINKFRGDEKVERGD